jgi:hypothetical protein
MGITKIIYRICIFIAVVLVVAPISIITMNYLGFCFKKGRFLSNEEKIRIAMQYIISSYPPSIARYEEKDGVKVRIGQHVPDQPINYKDLNSFLAENHDCCRLTRVATEMEGYSIRLEHRLIGSANTFVELKYKVKYIDLYGIERSRMQTSYVAISNCGHAWSGF